MVRMHSWLFTGFLALAGFVIAGCDSAPKPATPPAEHDHDHDHDHGHDHAHDHDHGHEHGHAHEGETYAMVVDEVVELNEKIRDAFAKDDMEAADKPLHSLGNVLSKEVVELAEEAGIAGEDLEAVKTAVKQLMDEFVKVDDKIHGSGGVPYSEVEAQVNDGIATLQKYVPAEK